MPWMPYYEWGVKSRPQRIEVGRPKRDRSKAKAQRAARRASR